MKKLKGFTLIEVSSMVVLSVLLMGVLYKIFSGTWSNFYKSQTKLTNVRAASILLEHLKKDIRLSSPLSSMTKKPIIVKSKLLEFEILDETIKGRKIIRYELLGDKVQRTEGGGKTSNVSMAKVKKFQIEEDNPRLNVVIEVDDDSAQKARSASNIANKVILSAVLYPNFFKNVAGEEEKYWQNARELNKKSLGESL